MSIKLANTLTVSPELLAAILAVTADDDAAGFDAAVIECGMCWSPADAAAADAAWLAAGGCLSAAGVCSSCVAAASELHGVMCCC